MGTFVWKVNSVSDHLNSSMSWLYIITYQTFLAKFALKMKVGLTCGMVLNGLLFSFKSLCNTPFEHKSGNMKDGVTMPPQDFSRLFSSSQNSSQISPKSRFFLNLLKFLLQKYCYLKKGWKFSVKYLKLTILDSYKTFSAFI